MVILTAHHRRYGPDATLIGIADWLNAHSALLDRYFETYALDAIRLIEEMTEQDPEDEQARISPSLRILGVRSAGDVFGGRIDDVDYRKRFLLDFRPDGPELLKAVGDCGSSIRCACVLDERPYHAETYAIEIWRGGMVLGVLRYWDMIQFHRTDRDDALEQFFVWHRVDGRYLGQSIEMRLWNPYVHELFDGPEEEKALLRADPNALKDHRDVRAFEKSTYRPFYQMQRAPSRTEITRYYYGAKYDGENTMVRSAESSRPAGGA